MATPNIISVRSVSRRFGSVLAVDNVDLEIERGEFFSVLGPSGCGKTTLLRMLAGFETPGDGEIYIDGNAMSAIPPRRRPVNMVFQNYAIFPHLDVRRNIAFGLRKSKLPRAAVNARVDEMLYLIELSGYADRAPTELSGGERQRVALARALIKRPSVLLLDEPLGALDKKLRQQMQLELRVLRKSVGITFVFVTHDQEEALTLSDRIAVMANGKVLQVDTPAGIYESPASRFVADFIGSMNFFDGRFQSSANGAAIIDAGPLGTIETTGDGVRHAPGDRVTVAIRPEKLGFHMHPPEGEANVVEARMGAVAYLGDRSHCHVHLDGREEPVAVAVQNSAGPAAIAAAEGQPVWLNFSVGSVVLLGPE